MSDQERDPEVGNRNDNEHDDTDNGPYKLSMEQERALRNLRIYALVLLSTSLFFFGFSLVSYFYTRPSLSLYGLLSFGASTVTSVTLLTTTHHTNNTNNTPNKGRPGRRRRWTMHCHLCVANGMNCLYFAVAALFVEKHVSSNMSDPLTPEEHSRYVILAGVFFTLFLVSIVLGYKLLREAQQPTLLTTTESSATAPATAMDDMELERSSHETNHSSSNNNKKNNKNNNTKQTSSFKKKKRSQKSNRTQESSSSGLVIYQGGNRVRDIDDETSEL